MLVRNLPIRILAKRGQVLRRKAAGEGARIDGILLRLL
jgi:hypothetical protein